MPAISIYWLIAGLAVSLLGRKFYFAPLTMLMILIDQLENPYLSLISLDLLVFVMALLDRSLGNLGAEAKGKLLKFQLIGTALLLLGGVWNDGLGQALYLLASGFKLSIYPWQRSLVDSQRGFNHGTLAWIDLVFRPAIVWLIMDTHFVLQSQTLMWLVVLQTLLCALAVQVQSRLESFTT